MHTHQSYHSLVTQWSPLKTMLARSLSMLRYSVSTRNLLLTFHNDKTKPTSGTIIPKITFDHNVTVVFTNNTARQVVH